MVHPRLAAAFLCATATTTLAAPTKIQKQQRANTHCRCTVLSTTDTPFAPIYTPSAAHWTPAEPSPSSTPLADADRDACSDLGPALERLEVTYPDIYDGIIPRSIEDDLPPPRRTTFLLDLDVYEDILALQPHLRRSSSDYAAQRSEAQVQPQQQKTLQQTHIRCHTELAPESLSTTLSASQGTNLWATQVIVAFLLFACIAEAVHLAAKWIRTPAVETGSGPRVRLHGTEAQLLAIPTSLMTESDGALFSPGAEKKARAYENGPRHVVMLGKERREAYAYAYLSEEYEDDEVSRPVM